MTLMEKAKNGTITDEAVFAAYRLATGDDDWTPDMDDEQILEKLLALNLERANGG